MSCFSGHVLGHGYDGHVLDSNLFFLIFGSACVL
jgi:hypothetical protein